MSRRLTDRITSMVEEALDGLVQGDDVTWEYTTAAQQTGPVGVLFVFLPSGVIGEILHASIIWSNPAAVKPTDVVRELQQVLEALRTARSAELAKGAPVGVGSG